MQQYELQDATCTYSEEGYEATNSALASIANIDHAGTLAESIIDTTASIPMSPSTLVTANHTLSDNYNVDSSNRNGTKNSDKENGCIENQDKDTTQSEGTKCMEINMALVEKNEPTDVNVPMTIEEEQIDSQIHSTNKETKENAKSVKDDNSNVKTEHHSENSSLVKEAQNNEILTEAQILTNSDDIAVMAEFSSIEYSTEEEMAAPQETRHEQVALAEQISTLESSSVKSDLNESNVEITVKADAEFLESKLEPGSNEDSYNQSSQDEIDLHLTMQSTDSHRKVIQDIFDDWQDENCEEENNQSLGILKHHQDSVEKELQNLLNDDAQQVQTVSSTNAAETSVSSTGFLEQDCIKLMNKSKSAKSDNALLLNASTSAESTSIKSFKTTSSRSATRGNPSLLSIFALFIFSSRKTAGNDNLRVAFQIILIVTLRKVQHRRRQRRFIPDQASRSPGLT